MTLIGLKTTNIQMIKVTLVGFDGVLASALTGILDLFSMAGVSWNRIQKREIERLFHVNIASKNAGVIQCINGMRIQSNLAFCEIYDTDLVVIPTIGADIQDVLNNNPELLEFIQHAHQNTWMIAGNCTGNFILAEAGILNGRCATTHWGFQDDFKKRYPEVLLHADQLVTRDEHIYCAGGGIAWFDLGLHFIERFYGFEVAIETAKSFVIDYRRESQLSYSLLKIAKPHQDILIQDIQNWMSLNFSEEFSIDTIAEKFNITPRTLIRRFKNALDITPNVYIQILRVEAAQKQLEETQHSIEQIMQAVGYHDLSSFRRLFFKKTGLTPLEYRKRFSRRY
ncbi:HTH-type transcriptional regulator CdhR [Acinetobacter stercoris]|uniref:HTH-type transcriptional regulator CdhR n=2 Tax=Acinetobacter stercoris TaxID=2126983 RepID=A0A2U3MZA9_9GAMM|nr:HTH-type transcriptional regulator CdhR [Acinetobacter stercoris]